MLPTLLHYSVFVRSFVQDSALRQATLLKLGPQKQILLYYQKYITAHRITSHHTTPHHITSHHSTSHNTTPPYITSHHTTQHHITSHHTTSHHITSHNTTPHYVTSQHIIPFTVLLKPPFEHKLGCKQANNTEMG